MSFSTDDIIKTICCCICQDVPAVPVAFSCHHIVCFECWKKLRLSQFKCSFIGNKVRFRTYCSVEEQRQQQQRDEPIDNETIDNLLFELNDENLEDNDSMVVEIDDEKGSDIGDDDDDHREICCPQCKDVIFENELIEPKQPNPQYMMFYDCYVKTLSANDDLFTLKKCGCAKTHDGVSSYLNCRSLTFLCPFRNCNKKLTIPKTCSFDDPNDIERIVLKHLFTKNECKGQIPCVVCECTIHHNNDDDSEYFCANPNKSQYGFEENQSSMTFHSLLPKNVSFLEHVNAHQKLSNLNKDMLKIISFMNNGQIGKLLMGNLKHLFEFVTLFRTILVMCLFNLYSGNTYENTIKSSLNRLVDNCYAEGVMFITKDRLEVIFQSIVRGDDDIDDQIVALLSEIKNNNVVENQSTT